jgi:ArsR family transcriptional regulator
MFDLIAFCYALADQTRWRVVMLLAEGEMCVCEFVDVLDVPQSTLSGHLSIMRSSGVVEVQKIDKWAWYRLAPGAVECVNLLKQKFAKELSCDATLKKDRKLMAARVALRGRECSSARQPIPPRRETTARCC